jgi:hypothetical protein
MRYTVHWIWVTIEGIHLLYFNFFNFYPQTTKKGKEDRGKHLVLKVSQLAVIHIKVVLDLGLIRI